MKKYRIYKAKAFNEEMRIVPVKELEWEPTEDVYNGYNEAYVKKCDLLINSEFFYYSVKEELI